MILLISKSNFAILSSVISALINGTRLSRVDSYLSLISWIFSGTNEMGNAFDSSKMLIRRIGSSCRQNLKDSAKDPVFSNWMYSAADSGLTNGVLLGYFEERRLQKHHFLGLYCDNSFMRVELNLRIIIFSVKCLHRDQRSDLFLTHAHWSLDFRFNNSLIDL